MGLAGFNRMRRMRAPVEKQEAQRFKEDNETRNKHRTERLATHRKNQGKVSKLREEERKAMERVGEKLRAGLESDPADAPLRRDHAAEIAGRNIKDAQEPRDPVKRVDERIPPNETANEALVGHMEADSPGPDLEAVRAAAREVGAREPPEPRRVRPRSESEGDGEDGGKRKRKTRRTAPKRSAKKAQRKKAPRKRAAKKTADNDKGGSAEE